ncbi:MAG: hypothetical protein A3H97_25140 [Acidobacteria bacterium RIFCSPLOWO2_02_FULL_65_29]|nr:MAG: hypothetical protein A3H97_25140 [Acidobacteria bacterium RIFCSPLOWO2_02_FULL_65_29]
MTAVAQKTRKGMRDFTIRRVEGGGGRGRAAARRHSIERLELIGREENHAIATPRASLDSGCVAHHLHRPTCGWYLLDLALCAECHELAVGRPEGPARTFRPGNGAGRDGIQIADPELNLSVEGGDERQTGPIGRQLRRDDAPGLGWRQQGERLQRTRRLRSKVGEDCDAYGRRQEHRCDDPRETRAYEERR